MGYKSTYHVLGYHSVATIWHQSREQVSWSATPLQPQPVAFQQDTSGAQPNKNLGLSMDLVRHPNRLVDICYLGVLFFPCLVIWDVFFPNSQCCMMNQMDVEWWKWILKLLKPPAAGKSASTSWHGQTRLEVLWNAAARHCGELWNASLIRDLQR